MRARELTLCTLAIAFLALKGAEIAFDLESWPLSNVSMFSGRRPVNVIPYRSTLHIVRGGAEQVAGHDFFLLSEGEFAARMHPDRGVGTRCGQLVDAYNRASHADRERIVAAEVHVEPIKRPGIEHPATGWTVRCTPPVADTALAVRPVTVAQ